MHAPYPTLITIHDVAQLPPTKTIFQSLFIGYVDGTKPCPLLTVIANIVTSPNTPIHRELLEK